MLKVKLGFLRGLKVDKKVYIGCDCHSVEHITRFSYYEKDPHEIYLETHLTNYNNFWKRVWVAIKYIFGYRSKYGDFDCMILSPTSVNYMISEFNKFLEENIKYEKAQ